ncbi:MAG: hypothetical protein KY439_00210 [Actinobacteria bacterium]|nr:hypothetical protein [Actinomycetota bacterium]
MSFGPEGLRRWEVQRGDDFRSIATQVLHEVWHRPPSEAEIELFRGLLVQVNRDRLQDPANPDLLVHGQILLVPRTPRPLPGR